MQTIKSVINSFFSSNKLCWKKALMIDWKIICGNFSSETIIVKISEDIIIVGVTNYRLLHEFCMISSCILSSINNFLNQYNKKINDIKFVVIRPKSY